jgi:protein TonB
MFHDVVCPHAGSTRKWYTVPLSFAIHTAILIVCVVVPLVAVDVLPAPRSMMAFVTAPQLPVAPPVAVRKMIPAAPAAAEKNLSAAPLEAPPGIRPESGLVVEPEQSNIGTPGVIDGIESVALVEPPPPPPPPPVRPVRVSSLMAPARTRDVLPVYPPIAQSARVQGDVIIEATIGSDGKVQDARVLRSIPLLDQAAIAAVRAWEYTPTLLNGQPVPIIMTVTVRFRLR